MYAACDYGDLEYVRFEGTVQLLPDRMRGRISLVLATRRPAPHAREPSKVSRGPLGGAAAHWTALTRSAISEASTTNAVRSRRSSCLPSRCRRTAARRLHRARTPDAGLLEQAAFPRGLVRSRAGLNAPAPGLSVCSFGKRGGTGPNGPPQGRAVRSKLRETIAGIAVASFEPARGSGDADWRPFPCPCDRRCPRWSARSSRAGARCDHQLADQPARGRGSNVGVEAGLACREQRSSGRPRPRRQFSALRTRSAETTCLRARQRHNELDCLGREMTTSHAKTPWRPVRGARGTLRSAVAVKVGVKAARQSGWRSSRPLLASWVVSTLLASAGFNSVWEFGNGPAAVAIDSLDPAVLTIAAGTTRSVTVNLAHHGFRERGQH